MPGSRAMIGPAASPVGNTPQAFAREIRDDIAKWAKVIKDAKTKLAN